MANKTMHHVIIGDDTYEIVDQYAREHGAEIDATLTQSGKAADAKAVGDALKNVSGVPTTVRAAMLTLFQKAAYIETGLADEVAIIQSWASAVTGITLSASAISINGATASQLIATTSPAGGIVTWESSNLAVATVSSTGLVTGVGNGTCTITASSGDVSATCTATVTGFATLTGIDATYTQSGTVYDTDALDSLRSDLAVTGTYDDTSTATITDYTLSGTLTEGASTITVSYGGMTDTFNVTVSHIDNSIINWDFTQGLVDSKQGLTVTLGGSATQDTSGVHITAANDFINLGKILGADKRFEIDIANMDAKWSSSTHGRLFIWYSGNGSGVVYRSSGTWTIYAGSWKSPSVAYADRNYFANSTVKIKVGSSSDSYLVTVYKDNEELFNFTTNSNTVDGNNDAYIGGGGATGAFDMTITGFRVYSEV